MTSPSRSSAKRFAFDGVAVAAVFGEVDRVGLAGEGGEDAAGFDGGELVVVADEDDFGVRPGRRGVGAGRVCGCRPWRLRRRPRPNLARPIPRSRSKMPRRRSRLHDRIPAFAWSSAAVRAASAVPITG